MVIKVLAVIGFVAVASAADLSIGHGGGKLIFEQNVTASPAIWRQVKILTVNATNTTDEVISRVVVTDNRPEKDGEATVIEGGEGEKNVTLEFKSPAVFRGLDFYVQVFAAAEGMTPRLPKHPKATGGDTQNHQVPKVLNVSETQKPKKGDDIIIGAPKPTASSTTEASHDGQQKIKPALVGKDQTRLSRDTQDKKTKDQAPVPKPVEVDATKATKVNENANKTVEREIVENWKNARDLIFDKNSKQKNEANQKVVPVKHQAESVEEDRKVRQATKDTVLHAVPIELTNDHHTTPKSEVSSTTAKNVGQEKNVPKVVPVTGVSTKVPSTTSSDNLTTKLPENATKVTSVTALPKELTNDHHTTPKSEVSSTTAKNLKQEKNVTKIVSVTDVSTKVPPTTSSDHLTTKLPENAIKLTFVPALPKELTNDHHTTPKSEVSSTTAKNVGHEKNVPKVVPVTGVSTKVPPTTSSGNLTTKLPENDTKVTSVPALPKELTNDHHTTPKSEVSSTTAKNLKQEKNVPKIVTVTDVSTKVPSTTSSDNLTTKLPENATKVTSVPTLPKDLTNDHHAAPKSEVSSTTAKNLKQEKNVPKIVPVNGVSTEVPSTTWSYKLTTKLPEDVQTTQELEQNFKGHHFVYHHAVPLPYVN